MAQQIKALAIPGVFGSLNGTHLGGDQTSCKYMEILRDLPLKCAGNIMTPEEQVVPFSLQPMSCRQSQGKLFLVLLLQRNVGTRTAFVKDWEVFWQFQINQVETAINSFPKLYVFCVQKGATKVHGFGLAKQWCEHLRGNGPKIATTSWKRSWQISTTFATKQVVVGLRSTRKFGIPQPWRPAGSRRV